jgi:hypothetical protein
MKLLSLDIATVCGFALGEAGTIPRSGSVRLKGRQDGPEIAAWNMRNFLRDQFTLDKPDMVVIEHYLHPTAQKSGDAVILQLMCFGAAMAEIISKDIMCEKPHAATVRKHFIGASNMGERKATKDAVIKRARLLGYIPRDCVDDNRADACALFDFASATYARVSPKALVLFGEAAQ